MSFSIFPMIMVEAIAEGMKLIISKKNEKLYFVGSNLTNGIEFHNKKKGINNSKDGIENENKKLFQPNSKSMKTNVKSL